MVLSKHFFLMLYYAKLLNEDVDLRSLFVSVDKGKHCSCGPLSTLIKTVLLSSCLEKLVNLTVSPARTLTIY